MKPLCPSVGINRRSFLRGMAALGGAAMLGVPRSTFGDPQSPPATLPTSSDPRVPVSPFDPETVAAGPLAEPAGGVQPLFASFFMGGFECSTHHRVSTRRRLDMIAATRHDVFAEQDYARMVALGMRACRDGTRWHLIDRGAQYDFSSLLPMVKAARSADMQVAWDLMHYGWPDDIDFFKPQFVKRFAAYSKAIVKLLDGETDQPLIFSPVNEISFVAWAGGDKGFFDPFQQGRGLEVKCQLVRAAVEAMNAIREVRPDARFLHCDPVIHVLSRNNNPGAIATAEAYRQAQYESWDMIRGDRWPQLGGSPDLLDIIGVNYYWNNQEYFEDHAYIMPGDRMYKPFADIVLEVWNRYRRPIIVAETGIEDGSRPAWLRYMAGEAGRAMDAGAQVHGLAWYPILSHPGWDNDRHCHNGLWDYADNRGQRPVNLALAGEVKRLERSMQVLRAEAIGPVSRAKAIPQVRGNTPSTRPSSRAPSAIAG